MTVLSEQTVRDIAMANPASTRVFENLGIDYCCGGKHSLRTACERADVPLSTVIESLEECQNAAPTGAPVDAPLGELTRHIVKTHHAFVRNESPRIQALLAKVCGKHGPSHPELIEVQTLFTGLEAELAQHMMKEEAILFPYIEAMADSANPPARCSVAHRCTGEGNVRAPSDSRT